MRDAQGTTPSTGTNGRLETSSFGIIAAPCIRLLAVIGRASGAPVGPRPQCS